MTDPLTLADELVRLTRGTRTEPGGSSQADALGLAVAANLPVLLWGEPASPVREFATELASRAAAEIDGAEGDFDLAVVGLDGDEPPTPSELPGAEVSHLLFVRDAAAVPRRLLVCVAVGEPGKADVAKEVGGVAALSTGRAGTGQVVSTTGVRGLSEEELKGAKFDEAQLKKAQSFATAADDARRYAAQGKLAARRFDYLPDPAKTADAGQTGGRQ